MAIGKRDKIFALWQKNKNLFANSISLNSRSNKEIKDIISSNRELKNKFAGQRCFIVGNGPSTKEQNLFRLSSEYVFTVNFIANNSQYSAIKSNFHFWTDPNIFKVDLNSDEGMYLVNSIISVNKIDNAPICFFSIKQKEFIHQNGIDNVLNVRYIAPSLGWIYEGFNEEFDLTKFIPQFGTVVQFCVASAIYMGFAEIYLLGCDNTGIVNTMNALIDNIDVNNYGYEVTEIEKRRMKSGAVRNGLEIEVTSFLQNIKGFRILAEYCKKRNIGLYNCSSRTVIDSIPRLELDEVLFKSIGGDVNDGK